MIAIYVPLSVDAFTSAGKTSLLMALMMTAPPLGVLAGYGITVITLSIYDSWRLSFFIMAGI